MVLPILLFAGAVMASMSAAHQLAAGSVALVFTEDRYLRWKTRRDNRLGLNPEKQAFIAERRRAHLALHIKRDPGYVGAEREWVVVRIPAELLPENLKYVAGEHFFEMQDAEAFASAIELYERAPKQSTFNFSWEIEKSNNRKSDVFLKPVFEASRDALDKQLATPA